MMMDEIIFGLALTGYLDNLSGGNVTEAERIKINVIRGA